MKYQTLSLVAGLLTSSLAADSCSMKHDSGFKNTHDDGVRTIDVSDQNGKVYNRKYGVYVPTDYNTQVSQGKKYPLIFDFHGRGSNAANQYDNSQYYKHTEVGGDEYLVVYPEGWIRNSDGTTQTWQGNTVYYEDTIGPPDDLEFVKQLLAKIEANYCVDTTRVYASGKSIGGGFVDTLACSDVGDSFAAFAMSSAALYNDTSAASCSKKRAVLEAHGFVDSTVKYNGDPDKHGGPIPKIPSWVSWWGQRACGSTPAKATIQNGYRTLNYTCDAYASVVFHYNVTNLGHCWPCNDGSNYDATKGDPGCEDTSLDFTNRVLKHFARWTTFNAPKN